MKLTRFVFALTLTAAALAYAQSDFQSFMQSQMSEFQEYRDARDKEFAGYLEKQWREFKAFSGESFDEVPKPKTIPAAPKRPAMKPEEPTKPVEVAPAPPERPSTPPPAPEPPALRPKPDVPGEPSTPPPPPAPKPGMSSESFTFHGVAVTIPAPPEMMSMQVKGTKNTEIADAWKTLATSVHEPSVTALLETEKTLGLNDWGLYLLADRFAERLYGGRDNRNTVLVWFLMNKAGFDTRVAVDGRTLLLLMPSTVPVYGIPYLSFDGTKYYALSAYRSGQKVNRLFTYEGSYPGADNQVNFSVRAAPRLKTSPATRTLRFSYAGTAYDIPVSYDTEVVSYFRNYPQAHVATLFGADPSVGAASSLAAELTPLVEGKGEREAVNLLLRFVQTSFDYATDEEQFGREKYLFPDETLRYPASDCEDRAILFAWLVKRLVGLDVVGLDYPGHIATAVRFSTPIPGDSVRVDGASYIVSDPTYVNADVGMTMPHLQNERPTVIRF